MQLDSFIKSISKKEPLAGISVYLEALWYDAKGDWHKSHQLIQDIDNASAAWIHAYLHRKEGDISNAKYWYHRATKKVATQSLDDEWKELVTAFIS